METKAQKIENNLKENANFYNNPDFTVEYIDCNDFVINWNDTFIDRCDIDEIDNLYRIDMIETTTTGLLLISIHVDEDELPF